MQQRELLYLLVDYYTTLILARTHPRSAETANTDFGSCFFVFFPHFIIMGDANLTGVWRGEGRGGVLTSTEMFVRDNTRILHKLRFRSLMFAWYIVIVDDFMVATPYLYGSQRTSLKTSRLSATVIT